MNISGILVVVKKNQLKESIAHLKTLPGVEVHQTEPENGRILITQEAPTIEEEMAGFRYIQSMPNTINTVLVYHVPDDGESKE